MKWAAGKRGGQEGVAPACFLQLLGSICSYQTHIQDSPIPHFPCRKWTINLVVMENKILSCWAELPIVGNPIVNTDKTIQMGSLPPPPCFPTSTKGNGMRMGANCRRKWNHAGSPGKECWWQQSWWVRCGHYLLMRLPRRLPLKSWWLWEQAFLHQ